MATDIRRMSKEDLDELNRQAKAWRSRDMKPTQDQQPEAREQMDLWDEAEDKSNLLPEKTVYSNSTSATE